MLTDYGNVVKGDKIFVDKIYEGCNHNDFDCRKTRTGKIRLVRNSQPGEVCEIICLRSSGKKSVDVTFRSTSGIIFTQNKRISTKVEVV
jgi:hypothetical protein